MEIRCIIIDDEPIARKGLRSYVEKISFLKLIGECEDAIQLNTMQNTSKPDLIFLDIEMPNMTGLQLLSSLQNPPKVIIVSAYEQYALKGYELDVIDYLLKPVTFERFIKAINKTYELLDKTSSNNTNKYIYVKSGKQLKKLFLIDILFIESMENYVVIYTKTSKDIIYSTLKQIQESLSSELFLQTHRSYIINSENVEAIDGNLLCIGMYKIPIARNYREKILDITRGAFR